MPRKKKPARLTTITKRLTSRGYYFYEQRKGKITKRISSASYFKRLRIFRSKRLNRKKKIHQRKIKASRIKKTTVKTTFARGFDYTKKVSIFFEASNIDFIVNTINKFYLEVKSRFKTLKKLMYFQLTGLLYADTEIDLSRSTRISFVKEYNKEGFRLDEIRRTVEKIYDLIGQQFYEYGEVTDFQLKLISINQRN